MSNLNLNCISDMCDVLMGIKDVSVEKKLYSINSKQFNSFEKTINNIVIKPNKFDEIFEEFRTSNLINDLIVFANELKNLKRYNPTDDNLNFENKNDVMLMHCNLVIGDIKNYYPENLKKSVFKHVEPWKLYAERNNVDIVDIVEKIEVETLKFDQFKDVPTLQEELKNIFELHNLLNKTHETFLILRNYTDDLNKELDENSQIIYDIYSKTYDQLKEALKTTILNNPEYSSLDAFLKHIEFNSLLENLRMQINSISDIIADKANIAYSEAHEYKNKQVSSKNADVYQFMQNKINSSTDIYGNSSSIYLDNGKYRTFTIFEDASALVIDDNNNIKVIRDNIEADRYIHYFFNEILTNKLSKNPNIHKLFKKMLQNSYKDFQSALISADTFINNQDILKATNFDFFKNKYRNFEELDDKMNENINDHKFKKFAFSIVSNKYKHLYDENSMEILKEIYDLGINADTLQDLVGKKIAAYKESVDFNIALNKMLDNFNNFSMDAMLEKAYKNNANIISKDDNVLILKINNFEQSQSLGSNAWCISRDLHYYKSYTSNDAKQYFIYDFNKNSKDNDSLIGLTLGSGGTISTSHYKNDDQYPYDGSKYIRKIQITIIKNTLSEWKKIPYSIEDEIKHEIYQKKLKINN